MITLNPYLVYKDNCEEAFLFYQQVFGGDILFMGRYKDVPAESRQYFPGCADEQIMHASLQINAGMVIMGNDNPHTYTQAGGAVINTFFLYINIDEQANAYRVFDELALGGKVIMTMAPTFWSQHYGIVTDRFGISWKVTYDAPTQQ